ncbi:MAG: hypothetical protein JSV96_08440 [Candidatus Aminicenantes bacterium]|nr:MAG: hypothetical protein JSV96_08440 [Candidatus Aminicenantes bacterium]
MELRDEIIILGEKAVGVIGSYFDENEKDGVKVDRAIRILDKSTKILHMNQIKDLREKSYMLQLVRFLPDEKVKKQYITMMNPQIGNLLLEGKPKINKK